MIDFTKIKKLTVDGVDLKSLAINGVQVWKSGPKNWVPFSINADGTIYNNGLGYKNGYRLSSSGGESSAPQCTVTGYIPAKAGDVIRIAGYQWFSTASALHYLNAYDSTKNFAFVYAGNARGTYQTKTFIDSMEYIGGVSIIKLKDGVSGYDHIRISLQGVIDDVVTSNANGANLIVTVNEEIT